MNREVMLNNVKRKPGEWLDKKLSTRGKRKTPADSKIHNQDVFGMNDGTNWILLVVV